MREKRKVAVIVNKKEDFDNIEKNLKNEYVSYNTVDMIKGIEFDTVIVKDNNMDKNHKYVSYTRAINELYILKERK